MSKVTTLQERIEIMEMAQAGKKDREIAEEMGWKISTIRKWRRRGEKEGRSGLASTMGRPNRGALSTYPKVLVQQLLAWCKRYPGWGAKTLHAELCRAEGWTGQAIPSVSSITRFLQEQGLCQSYERHSDLPQVEVPVQEDVHDRWEMDAKGYQRVEGVGYVSLINLNDRVSHVRLVSYPCEVGRDRWQRHPDTEDYQCVLRLAFSQWGLPKTLQVDHGSIYIDNQSKSPFPTRFHLWLLALGIDLRFGRIAQPRDQAITERSHQLWQAQCLTGQGFDDWYHLYHTLQHRQDFLNHHLGCRSLDNQSPLTAFPQARHSHRHYRPEWEADLLQLERVWDYLAQGRWYRRVAQGGTITIGQQVYYVGQAHARQDVELLFDNEQLAFKVFNAAGQLVRTCSIQGISITSLMGQLASRFNLPVFQLALPFAGAAQSVIRLFDITQEV